VILIASLVIVTLLTFGDYGVSNDEGLQQHYGELIIAYYASGFADQSVFHFENLLYYGGLFDVVAVLIGHVVPADPYGIRHLLCAIIVIGGIAATCATARLVAGPRAGAIASLALAVCGPWYGGMFNHTKDIPLAAAMIGATYFLIRGAREAPRPGWGNLLGFGLLTGAALGLRVHGLLLVVYAACAMLIWTPRPISGAIRDRARFIGVAALRFVPALVVAYLIMIAAWPWAALDLLNPLRALIVFEHFNYPVRTIVSGQVYEMAAVPRWYVPLYLAVKLHFAILLGASTAVLIAVWSRIGHWDHAHRWRRETLFVGLTVVLPLFCQVAMRGPAYTGLRHFLFVVPPLAVLAGIGLDALLDLLAVRHRIISRAAMAALGVVFVWYATVLARLHPDEYLFFNPLVGGLKGASGRYETDYWVNTLPEAVSALEQFLARTDRSFAASPWLRYSIAVCGQRVQFEEEAHPGLEWTSDWKHADFFIAPTHMECDEALDGTVVAKIERLGVTIGVVKDLRGSNRPAVANARLPVDLPVIP